MERSALLNRFTGKNAILLILAQALILRILVFNGVAVNGDTGLYLYDALQLTWGHQPFVDFPARSPAYQYPLAAVLALFPDHRLIAARGFMAVISLLVALAVYALAREITGDERVALAAMALYALTPFTLTWGLWVKTETVSALFIAAAFVVTLRVIDRDTPPAWAAIAVGTLFSLALLTRRVAFVHLAAISLFVLWYRHRHHTRSLASTMRLGAITATAGLTGLFLVLAGTAHADPTLTWTFFDMYFIDLFRSGGFGAHGYLPLFGENYVQHQYANVGPNSLFQSVCQKCGARTVVIFIQTMKVTLVALVPLLVWLQALVDRAPLQFIRDFLPVLLIVEAGLGVFYTPSAWPPLAVFAVAVLFIWHVDHPSWRDLWSPKAMLPFLALILLTAGYLYRDRIIYTTYFQDFYPFIAVLGGIALVAMRDRIGPIARPGVSARRVRKVGAIILVLALYPSSVAAYPYIGPDGSGGNANWYTVNGVEAYGWDMEQRLKDDELVFAANPLYVVETRHRLVQDMSRRYYLFEGWPNTTVADDLGYAVPRDLRSDRVPVAVMTSELRTVINAHPAIEDAFYDEFCEVDDPLYNTTEFRGLWVKRDDPDTPACGTTVERDPFVMEQVS